MHRLRFQTALDLYGAFPMVAPEVGEEATEENPVAFAQRLAGAGKELQALIFCAYLLPRREAVLWACDSARALPGAPSAGDVGCVDAAEQWLRAPDEATRYRAHLVATAADQASPPTWAAHAAGYASRNLLPPDIGQAPLPEHLTALAAGTLFKLAPLRLAPDEKPGWFRARLERGIQLAAGPMQG